MTGLPSQNLLEQLVDLTGLALGLRRGMSQHLSSRVLPHLDPAGPDLKMVRELADLRDEAYVPHVCLAQLLGGAIAEIRGAIATGTSEEQVDIPRARLIGCTEVVETRTTRSPDAAALQAALAPLEDLHRAVWTAVTFAEAIRVSISMLEQD